jgi:hypothetical protein
MPYERSLISRFESSILQVDELLVIHTYLMSAPNKQVSDNLLRACITMMVSTIDTFVNELIINSIMYELRESRLVFDLKKIKIDIGIASEADIEVRYRNILICLRRQYSKETFQSSRQIENGLSAIGIQKIWKNISDSMMLSGEDIKKKLDLLVYRRNQIVHEGDLDHLHTLREIERNDVDDARRFSENLIRAMLKVYSDKISTAKQNAPV